MLNKDILIHLYNGLTRYDHALIGKIRQTCKMFSYYPKNVLSVEYEGGRTFYRLLVGDKVILHREGGPAVEWAYGCKEWWIHGERHREDGPAVEWADGDKEWWIRGKRHRSQGMNPLTDGPAIEESDGHKEWWVHGERHREDGPAVEYADGYKSWWLHGERYVERDFNIKLKQLSR